ncbi:MAG: pyridoxal phosphate-dependent aminotransferase [Bosea sp.]|uniref:pyridoxal phosphate-dependent aminotransferase n=3 Tax=Bosea TaxID=85413 RepID=UPI000962C623|nr:MULTISPECIES: pyridoxal phosphate-dependent aminotransferase [unclassified Bosea (in: a-proteobacteria)]MBN9441105.1 pyridoxal phosphate-dependent aminotransferase [Bosea sp. (in: a-proteobacteria)]MBN9456798.1 pyridoxal phosphate-dependent aminotransferase [Bosea sp. (in: a-proteobacteria)]OJV09009.1 MAG: aspartate aminotransferase [Bosea sp. 67-29]
MNFVAPTGSTLIPDLRPEAREAPESGIVEVMNYGRLREGLIPLWVGEGDLPTPAFIREAAARSLAAGETFYTWQRGIPELREALARYHERLYGQPFSPERFYVTGSGMQSLQIAVRMIAGTGDELIIPTPAWPNFVAAASVGGARPVCVPMDYEQGRFTLDLGKLEAAITPRTRGMLINSPANPTGWTATREEQEALLALSRKHGIWIVADEIYGRFVYDGSARAPSFHDIIAEEDRVLFVQTFSKNWAMTGWRIGWIEAPTALGQVIENLVQYSTSGSPVFVQRAAVAALDEGESFIAEQIARAAEGRRIVYEGLKATNRVSLSAPVGAFYQFFSVDGREDSRALALDLIDKANVGLAPGLAFGPGGEKGLRLCFARKSSDLTEAVARLQKALMAA